MPPSRFLEVLGYCASIKKRMSFRLERSGMEESSHFELAQYANRCEGPSAASAPNGSDSGRDDMGFLEVLGYCAESLGLDITPFGVDIIFFGRNYHECID